MSKTDTPVKKVPRSEKWARKFLSKFTCGTACMPPAFNEGYDPKAQQGSGLEKPVTAVPVKSPLEKLLHVLRRSKQSKAKQEDDTTRGAPLGKSHADAESTKHQFRRSSSDEYGSQKIGSSVHGQEDHGLQALPSVSEGDVVVDLASADKSFEQSKLVQTNQRETPSFDASLDDSFASRDSFDKDTAHNAAAPATPELDRLHSFAVDDDLSSADDDASVVESIDEHDVRCERDVSTCGTIHTPMTNPSEVGTTSKDESLLAVLAHTAHSVPSGPNDTLREEAEQEEESLAEGQPEVPSVELTPTDVEESVSQDCDDNVDKFADNEEAPGAIPAPVLDNSAPVQSSGEMRLSPSESAFLRLRSFALDEFVMDASEFVVEASDAEAEVDADIDASSHQPGEEVEEVNDVIKGEPDVARSHDGDFSHKSGEDEVLGSAFAQHHGLEPFGSSGSDKEANEEFVSADEGIALSRAPSSKRVSFDLTPTILSPSSSVYNPGPRTLTRLCSFAITEDFSDDEMEQIDEEVAEQARVDDNAEGNGPVVELKEQEEALGEEEKFYSFSEAVAERFYSCSDAVAEEKLDGSCEESIQPLEQQKAFLSSGDEVVLMAQISNASPAVEAEPAHIDKTSLAMLDAPAHVQGPACGVTEAPTAEPISSDDMEEVMEAVEDGKEEEEQVLVVIGGGPAEILAGRQLARLRSFALEDNFSDTSSVMDFNDEERAVEEGHQGALSPQLSHPLALSSFQSEDLTGEITPCEENGPHEEVPNHEVEDLMEEEEEGNYGTLSSTSSSSLSSTVEMPPHGPVSLIPNGRAKDQVVLTALDSLGSLPLNMCEQAIRFKTELFDGLLYVFVNDLPSTCQEMFEGRRRKVWFVVQGQFSRPVSFNTVKVGSTFDHPLSLPGSFVVKHVVGWLNRLLGGAMDIQLTGTNPHILCPLISNAQIINVSRPGEQPHPLEALEDMRLYNSSLTTAEGLPWSAEQRREFFRQAANREGEWFKPGYVWTFHAWEHYVNFANYRLNFIFPLDMSKVLRGSAMQLMAKDDATGEYMMDFSVMHEKVKKAAARNQEVNLDL